MITDMMTFILIKGDFDINKQKCFKVVNNTENLRDQILNL